MSKLSLRIFINTSLSVVSDPQILKLNPNEHKVWIQNWIIQSNPEWKIKHSIPVENSSTKGLDF